MDSGLDLDFDLADATEKISVALIMLLLVSSVLSAVAAGFINTQTTSATVPADNEFSSVSETPSFENLSVAATSGQALRLDGGYVPAPADVTIDDNNGGTLMATAALDSGANQSAAYHVAGADGDLVLRFDDGQWLAIYANQTTTTASAPASSATDYTTLSARWDGASDELTLFVDGSAANTTSIGTTEQRQVANNLDGRIEEVRIFDSALGNSPITTYHGDPINSLNGQTHETRLLFDEGEGSSTLAFYQGAQADIVGPHSWTTGVEQGQTPQAGTDFEVSGNSIRVVSGGYLDGQPKLYLSFESGFFGGLVATIFNVGPAALQLIVVGVLVMGASALYRELGGLGGG